MQMPDMPAPMIAIRGWRKVTWGTYRGRERLSRHPGFRPEQWTAADGGASISTDGLAGTAQEEFG